MQSKVLIFSDVHGNLPAFQKMLAQEKNIDLYVSLGDIVDYGPWSNECVELLEKLKPVIKIKGNHDVYFETGKIPENLSGIARQSFEHIYPDFHHADILSKYQNGAAVGNFWCTHTLNGKYIYPDTVLHLDQNCFVGHSHHQFQTKADGFTLINPGSVGQNRANINIIQYAIFDPKTAACEFHSLPYDVDEVIQEMKRREFPTDCIAYYEKKPRK